MVQPLFHWIPPRDVAVDLECLAIGVERGISERLLRILASRGVAGPDELRMFLAPP